jgi:hypothetical protein
VTELVMTGFVGTDPLGLFGALGALDVVHRAGRNAMLRWTDDVVPEAVLTGVEGMEDLADLVVADAQRWRPSPVLAWGPESGLPQRDAKPSQTDLRRWMAAALDHGVGERADIDLLTGIVAEGALAGKGEAKPTHFHFTAGQQQFLAMVRQLADAVTVERIEEAVIGPWRRDSPLPVLGWEAGGERIYAVRASNPASDKKLGTPGADWLGFVGLTFFPVAARRGRLETTGCAPAWKRGWFRWPLWIVPVGADVVRSALADTTLWEFDERRLRLRGVSRVMEAPIRRTDQGGYGSFGAATEVSLRREPVRVRGRSSSSATGRSRTSGLGH